MRTGDIFCVLKWRNTQAYFILRIETNQCTRVAIFVHLDRLMHTVTIFSHDYTKKGLNKMSSPLI